MVVVRSQAEVNPPSHAADRRGGSDWLRHRWCWPAAGPFPPWSRWGFAHTLSRANHYVARLNWLASALKKDDDSATFDSCCSHYLSYDESRKPELPAMSTHKDASLYAQGYLDERQDLQPNRPKLPPNEDLWQFCWDYHQGRLLTWNIAGNHPDLPRGVQLGIADRRTLASPTLGGVG